MVSLRDNPASTSTAAALLPGLAELWVETLGDPSIQIAILDGPVDQSHPCFAGANLRRLPPLVSDSVSGGRMAAHATHVASTIFGQPGSPIHGVSPGCSGLIIPIFSDDRPGPASQLDLARAIQQAVEAGAHVINISGGELSTAGEAEPMLADAVRFCDEQGVLIVAAAGNNACRCLHVPAALPSVLAVGAMNSQGTPLESSNWGDIYRSQGILAPGENIVGAAPGGGVARRTGTSFATPIVTGIVALLLSVQLARGARANSVAIRQAILASALPCDASISSDCQRFLAGRLDLPGAYAAISNRRRTVMPNEPSQATMLLEPSPHDHVNHDAQGVLAQEAIDQPPAAVDDVSAALTAGPHAVAAAAGERAETVLPGSSPTERDAAIGGQRAPMPRGGVLASDCACQGNGSRRLVFAIGSLGFDFGTEARRDGFRLSMPNFFIPEGGTDLIPFVPFRGGPAPDKSFQPNPYDARQLVKYLGGFPPPQPPFPTEGGFPRTPGSPAFPPVPDPPKGYPSYPAHLSDAAELIWVLNIELTPIYAIRPVGNFSTEGYQRLVEFLAGQVRHPDDPEYVSRVSIPGVLTNETVQLFSGQVVPVVIPNLRGMYAWNENALITDVVDKIKTTRTKEVEKESNAERRATKEKKTEESVETARGSLRNFLDRIYYDIRNLGQTSAERALNYTATNAFQAAFVFSDAASQGMQLDRIVTERSAFCRKDSDCWDVKLRFFDPENVLRARMVARFTIDVSDTFPVLVGPVRSWSEPG